jgi:hypothetical protein
MTRLAPSLIARFSKENLALLIWRHGRTMRLSRDQDVIQAAFVALSHIAAWASDPAIKLAAQRQIGGGA